MRIALAQMKNAGNMKANLDKSLELIKEAAENKADLILFPEVQLTEFFPQYEGKDVSKYKLGIDSEEVKAFQNASREHSIISVPNVYLEENGKTYDASLFIGMDGEIKEIQKMIHVAQAEQFYEQDYYTPSDVEIPHGAPERIHIRSSWIKRQICLIWARISTGFC